MRKKVLIPLFAALICGLAWANWPSGEAADIPTLKRIPVGEGIRRKLTENMVILERHCRESKYGVLEKKGFALTPLERALEKEASGRDPVETNLATMKRFHAALNWSELEMYTYENAPDFFDVMCRTRDEKHTFRFRFRQTGAEKFGLYAVEMTD